MSVNYRLLPGSQGTYNDAAWVIDGGSPTKWQALADSNDATRLYTSPADATYAHPDTYFLDVTALLGLNPLCPVIGFTVTLRAEWGDADSSTGFAKVFCRFGGVDFASDPLALDNNNLYAEYAWDFLLDLQTIQTSMIVDDLQNVQVGMAFAFNDGVDTQPFAVRLFADANILLIEPAYDPDREIATRMLLQKQDVRDLMTIALPAWSLNDEIGQRYRVFNRLLWNKITSRIHEILSQSFDLNQLIVRDITLEDIRLKLLTFFDSGLAIDAEVSGNGVARIDQGSVRSFARASDAWTISPSDRLVRVVRSDGEMFTNRGMLLERASTNYFPNSAFQDELDDWTVTGSGVDGSIVEFATYFALVVNYPGCVHIVAGTPVDFVYLSNTTTVATFTGFCSIMVAHIDYGEQLYIRIKRNFDDEYYDGSVFDAADTWIPLDLKETIADVYSVVVLDVGSNPTSITIDVGIPDTGVDGQEHELLAVQFEAQRWSSSLMPTRAASTKTRAAAYLTVTNDVEARSWNASNGVGVLRWSPWFNTSDLNPEEKFILLSVYYDDDNGWEITYQDGYLRFVSRSEGVETGAFYAVDVTRWSLYYIAFQWEDVYISTRDIDGSFRFFMGNPLVWLPGDGRPIDIVSGTRARLIGGTTYDAGPGEEDAFAFDGVNDFISYPADPGITSDAEIEGHVFCSDDTTVQPVFEFNDDVDPGVCLYLNLDSDGVTPLPGAVFADVREVGGTHHYIATAGGLFSENTWFHVSLRYNAATGIAKIFVEGTEEASVNVGIFTLDTAKAFTLGRRTSPWSEKPPIGVTVDTTHALSSGMVSAYLFRESTSYSTAIDDKGSNDLAGHNMESGDWSDGTGEPYGPMVTFDNNGSTDNNNTEYLWSATASGLPTGPDPRAVTIWFRITPGTDGGAMVSLGQGKDWIAMRWERPFTAMKYLWTEGVSYALLDPMPAAGWHCLTLSQTDGVTFEHMLDGVLISTQTIGGASSPSTFPNRMSIGGHYLSPGDQGFSGDIAQVVIHDRAVSLAEHQEMNTSPWAFMEPEETFLLGRLSNWRIHGTLLSDDEVAAIAASSGQLRAHRIWVNDSEGVKGIGVAYPTPADDSTLGIGCDANPTPLVDQADGEIALVQLYSEKLDDEVIERQIPS